MPRIKTALVGVGAAALLGAGPASAVDLVLGEQVFNYVLLNKKRDWQEYRAQVTPYELASNLELL